MSKQNGKSNGVPHRKGATGKSKAEAARENGKLGGTEPNPINWDVFDGLCRIQCTQVEIAGVLKCSVDTLERRVQDEKGMGYAEYYAQKSEEGKASLRRMMYKVAMGDPTKGKEPDVQMLKRLGEVHLGHSSKLDVKVGGSVAITSADPEDLVVLLIELVTNPKSRDELNGRLKPHGIQLFTNGAARKIGSGT